MRTERWLRIIGLGAWLTAGSTSIVRFARNPAQPGFALWTICYLAFGVVFWLTVNRHASRTLRVVGLITQLALAVTLAFIGMPLFEGALLALVVCQVPMVLPLWATVPWVVVQVAPLWFVLSRTYDRVEVTKGITSYLGFSAFAVGAVYLFEAERRARVDLDRTVSELVATRALLAESTRVAERVRISRELHDVLGHHLAALAIHLDFARRTADEKSRGALEETRTSVQRMLHDVRATVHEMRDGGAIDLGVALRAMVATLPGIAVKLEVPETLRIADAKCAHAAFRCVQEAVTNVLNHADATSVRIAVKLEEERVDIVVLDDGCGTGIVKPGGGLRGMRERIEGLGGTLEITGTRGGGTTVHARISLTVKAP